MTVEDSKGIDFDDVLVFNFFEESSLDKALRDMEQDEDNRVRLEVAGSAASSTVV